jgi:hypothetical protein
MTIDVATPQNILPVAAKYTSPQRDPHVLPNFTLNALLDPPSPLLYLPPLLSSLPEKYARDFSPASPHNRNDALSYAPLNTATRLPDIDPASFSLHKALHRFRPITPDYADVPYSQAFNWDELILPIEEEREWYCVVFRSKRKVGSKSEALYEADKNAHEEAVQNGGLIAYWYGVPDPVSGLNLATCIWQSRKHAIAANSRPHHMEAMRLTAESYERYDLERHVLRKVKGECSPAVYTFTTGDVGW